MVLNNKGAVSIRGILVSFVAIISYSALLPSLNAVITDIAPQVTGMTLWVIQLFPLIILLTIILKTFERDSVYD